jgi:hypothetical protein
MGTLLQDLRYGFRMLLKSPGITGIAILTLGLGIGANTAIFSVIHGVLLKPPPLPHSDRVVVFWGRVSRLGPHSGFPSDLRRAAGSDFRTLVAFQNRSFVLTGEAERACQVQVTEGIFRRRGPAADRPPFRDEEHAPRMNRVVAGRICGSASARAGMSWARHSI